MEMNRETAVGLPRVRAWAGRVLLVSSASPGGSEPTTPNVYGATPPLAVTVSL